MKTQYPSSARGFTLIELLVVIAIIAVLASAGFGVGNIALQKARQSMALRVCTGIELGVNNFFTEYSTLPTEETEDTPVATPLETDKGAGRDFIRILLAGEPDTGKIMNIKGIKFLEVKEGKADKDGLIYDTAGTEIQGLFDPWGGPYHVILDAGYDEKIEVKPKGAASSKILNGRRVAAWSNGADGAKNDSTGKVLDDVTTW